MKRKYEVLVRQDECVRAVVEAESIEKAKELILDGEFTPDMTMDYECTIEYIKEIK